MVYHGKPVRCSTRRITAMIYALLSCLIAFNYWAQLSDACLVVRRSHEKTGIRLPANDGEGARAMNLLIDEEYLDEEDSDEIAVDSTMSVDNQGPINFTCSYPANLNDNETMAYHNAIAENWEEITEPSDSNRVQITVFNTQKKNWVHYNIMPSIWRDNSANAYDIKTFSMKDGRWPQVRLAMKIFWTVDYTNMPELFHFVAIKETFGYPLGQYPKFAEVTQSLSVTARRRMVRASLQEAFDHWSDALDGRIIFEYVPYDSRLKASSYFDMVILISLRPTVHYNEHSGTIEKFNSRSVMAHAVTNFVHLNSDSTSFYIAPHRRSKRVHIAIDHKNRQNQEITVLREVSPEELARRYQQPSYEHIYEHRRMAIVGMQKHRPYIGNCLVCVVTSMEVTLNAHDSSAIKERYRDFLTRTLQEERRKLKADCRRATITRSHWQAQSLLAARN